MIEHEVTVLAVDQTSRTLHVRLVSQSACAACSARKMCAVQDSQSKEWTVSYPAGDTYAVGDKAMLAISEKTGFKAVLLAYVAPFVCLIGGLFALAHFTQNELAIGLSALGCVALYFLILFFLNKRISHTLHLSVHPIPQ